MCNINCSGGCRQCAPDDHLEDLISELREMAAQIPSLAIGNYVQGYRAAMSRVVSFLNDYEEHSPRKTLSQRLAEQVGSNP